MDSLGRIGFRIHESRSEIDITCDLSKKNHFRWGFVLLFSITFEGIDITVADTVRSGVISICFVTLHWVPSSFFPFFFFCNFVCLGCWFILRYFLPLLLLFSFHFVLLSELFFSLIFIASNAWYVWLNGYSNNRDMRFETSHITQHIYEMLYVERFCCSQPSISNLVPQEKRQNEHTHNIIATKT